ncbi:general transcriptional corepressor tupA-like [Protopterus annectens]|uniref:general transcriptional corepressor tupA-like n=1 Tax=Protopterus annectens TaxID=7888 RepID=UPI001CFB099C|nr:general transcriptional corepressor tupA-like [Protopterus annectens]
MYSLFVTPRRVAPSAAASYQLRRSSFGSEVSEDLPVLEPSTDGHLQLLQVIDCGSEVMCCRFNKEGTLLAVGLMNGNIKIYQRSDGACVYHLSDEDTINSGLPVTQLQFLPQAPALTGDIIAASYASGYVKFWHVSTQSCLSTVLEDRQTFTVAFNSSGTRFTTAGSSTRIYVYDTETKETINVCQPSPSSTVMNGHRFHVFAVTFHPDYDDCFISGGWDDTVQFWNVNNQHSVRKLFGPHVCGDALQIDPTTNQILTGSWRKDNALQIWDYETGAKTHEVPNDVRGHSLIYSCRWVGDYIAVGGTRFNMFRLIDKHSLMTKGCLINLPQGVYSIDVIESEYARPIIAVSSRNEIYMVEKTSGTN